MSAIAMCDTTEALIADARLRVLERKRHLDRPVRTDVSDVRFGCALA